MLGWPKAVRHCIAYAHRVPQDVFSYDSFDIAKLAFGSVDAAARGLVRGLVVDWSALICVGDRLLPIGRRGHLGMAWHPRLTRGPSISPG